MKSARLLLLFAVALTACGKEAPPPVKAVRPALTQLAGSMAVADVEAYSGEIRARHELLLGFRSGGKIVERLVEAGVKVRAGQLLARIDPADAGLQADAARTQYKLAENDLMRYRELHSKGFVSQSALDAKEAGLQTAKAQAGLALNQSDYTALYADKEGIVTAVLADVGQVVSAGQAVVRLAQSGEMEVSIEIPEAQFFMHQVGDAAEVLLLSGEGGVPLSGRLRELSPAADPVSRTYAARVTLTDPAKVALGMTARVRFIRAQRSTPDLLIPVSAIYQQGRHTAVWIVAADHSVSLRQVEIVAWRDGGAVIGSGLSAGERIVSAGVHRLSPGEKILPVESASGGAL
ncbi:MAG: efflux RND transporter periplasmic adaptor subunit [Gallionella sp.]|nr:efflux RND transporter periplasmic adaptor subunit [Gallionella sp.]